MRSFGVVALLCLVAMVAAHSWIDCTDYTESTVSGTYSNDKCRARPRNWSRHSGGGVLGADTGYNFQGSQPYQCMYPLTGGNYQSFYTAQYPMATYSAGQSVNLRWPAKNHVAATCTNAFIPDTSNKIYMSPINPTADPTTEWVQIADFGANQAGNLLGTANGGKGFQNCPKFCDGMDKAECGQSFTIPANTPPGRYAFQWRWVFNAGTPPYVSCWDAMVTSSSGSTAAPTTAAPTTPGTTTTTAAPAPTQPLTGDSVRIVSPPTYVADKTTTITVAVEYSATQAVDIIVDFLSAGTYNWFGKAIQKNVGAGKGTLNLSISVQNAPTVGSYIIKPWIVAAGKGEAAQGWAYELDKKEYSLAYGGAAPSTLSPNAPVGATSKIVAGLTVLVVVGTTLLSFVL